MLQPAESCKCLTHPSQTLDFYCEPCRTLVCTSCVLSPNHRAHSPDMTDAIDVIPSHKAKLQEYIDQANACLQGAENMMDNSAGSLKTLQDNCKRAESNIQKYFYRMRAILTDREHHFCNILKRSVADKKKGFTEQRQDIKASLTGVIDGMKAIDELLQRNDISLLRDEVKIIDKLNQHMNVINSKVESTDLSDFDTTVTMPCFEDYSFETICRQVGDPDFRVCPHNASDDTSHVHPSGSLNPASSSSSSPLKKTSLSKTLSNPGEAPPVPPRPLSNQRLKASSFTTSGNSELTESGEFVEVFSANNNSKSFINGDDVPPPLPPKSPITSPKRWPQWMEDYRKELNAEKDVGGGGGGGKNGERNTNSTSNGGDVSSVKNDEKENDVIPPPIPPKSPKMSPYKRKQNKSQILETQNGCISPVPKPRSKLTSLGDIAFEHHMVTVQPPTPVSLPPPPFPASSPKELLQPSLEITSKMMLGSTMKNKEESVVPCDVCIGADNVIIVTDKSSMIRILKMTGKLLDIIGRNIDIGEPVAVTTDTIGNVYILDRAPSPKLLKFTKTGKFISKLIYKTLRNSILGNPRGLALTHDGHILISDWEKSVVHVFDSTGKYESHFSPPDCDSFQPTGLCIDNRGRVIVSDYSNHFIWIFTPQGDLLHHFGWEGSNPGDLYFPYGVAVNAKGQIFVAESGNHRVSVFSNSGTFLNSFGEYGSEPGQFQCPLNLCITPCGQLIVADESNGRLQVFDKMLF